MKMTRALPVAAILGIAVASGFSPLLAQNTRGTSGGGAYTTQQAAAGAQLYTANCSACHGADLRGPVGPALIGDAFTSQWTGESAYDPYMLMIKNMPLNAPGSLAPAQYLAIMAYILQQNKFQAGSSPATPDSLRHVKIVSPTS